MVKHSANDALLLLLLVRSLSNIVPQHSDDTLALACVMHAFVIDKLDLFYKIYFVT